MRTPIRLALAAAVGGAAVLLTGCVAYPAYGDGYYGGGPAYVAPAPVVVSPSIGFYGRGYYGRGGYYRGGGRYWR